MGFSKTLIVLVRATLCDIATIILILPTVALRSNILICLDKVNVKYHV